MIRPFSTLLACFLASAALAEVPKVVTDIAPVHSLAARVMQGVGAPTLILPPGASPHTASLRPSQAGALDGADLVIWIGPELTPWLEKPMETLAGDAAELRLLGAEGTTRREYRGHDDDDDDHDHEAEDDHDHDHAEGEDHDHEDHAEGDDHDHEGEEHHHHHTGTDPHAWLDPANGSAWLGVIAETLAGLDPEHAATYRANALAGQAELATLAADLETELAPAQGKAVATFHDGFGYFETRYGIVSAGTLLLGDASTPSPARLARLRDAIGEMGVTCLFAEPQYDDRLVHAAAEGQGVRIAVLDPLGASLELGPALYPALLRAMGDSVATCLAP
ncbi:MAG: zinc ABC transporter substrate-binding protein [Rhodobacteraceae bacterium]|nr:zinc ABC transporter substrate-binding protein [Paracoccaceae bacterium]